MIDFGGEFTGRLLADAGIVPGMRVLGADLSPEAVAGARRRASEQSAGNVAFEMMFGAWARSPGSGRGRS